MKRYLTLIVMLACSSSTPLEYKSPIDEIPAVPVQIARGTDGKTEWMCQLQKLDQSKVEVECQFHNNSKEANETCIKVSYYDNESNNLVTESSQICSGLLVSQNDNLVRTTFVKNKRRALQRCGELLDLCVMLAGNH